MFGHARMISAGLFSFFSLPVNITLKKNIECIKWSCYIDYFKRYVNLKSDYLELLLSVYISVYIRLSKRDQGIVYLFVGQGNRH